MILTKAELKAIFGSSDFAIIKSTKVENKNVERSISLEPKNVTISKEEVKALAKKIGYVYQDGDEQRVFQLTFTDETIDRYGDIVKANGGDFKNYLSNPVVLPFHDSHAFPIGQTLKLSVDKTTNKVSGLILIVQESVDPTGTSEVFFKMLRTGLLKAGSIGFLPKKWTFPDEKMKKDLGMSDYGVVFDEWELLEFSICSVPANPNALQNAFENKTLSRDEVKKAFALAKEKNFSIPDEWIKAVDAISIPEKPKHKTLESWFESDESFIREIKDIEEFIVDSLVEKEIQAEPKIFSLEGKLKSNGEIKIHSYIFPKSAWTFEDAQKYFTPKIVGENEKLLKELIATLAEKISKLEEANEAEPLPPKDKDAELVAGAITLITNAVASLNALATYLSESLNEKPPVDEPPANPNPDETGTQTDETGKSIYDGDLKKEIEKLLKV
jgi:phage head maturation protease